MSDIVLKNICKKYENGRSVVEDFNLHIADKEFIVFVGPSGCGKSTTLRMIAGLEEISDGELWIDDQLSNYIEPQERGLSMVFQNYALYPNMTVYGNLAFALKIRKYSKKEIDKKVREIAEMLEIGHLLHRRPGALSGGQKQRVAIGSAIIRKPKAFLMDEPLSNLDAKLRAQMRVEFAKLHKALETTIIYVTHDQTEAMTLGTRIVVMKDGRVQQADTPERIYRHPANRFVAEFIGAPTMNILKCRVTEEGSQAVLLIDGENVSGTHAGECGRVYLKGAPAKRLLNRYRGKEVVMGIRPEDVCEYDEAVSKGFAESCEGIEMQVKVREMLGSEVVLYFQKQERSFAARLKPENRSQIGENIRLCFDPEKIHIFDTNTEENVFY